MNVQKPILSGIAAMAENKTIGKNNQLPWHLPADLKHFKQVTTGHPVLMGRKTYQSIGKPLPNRTNIILTKDQNFSAPDCIVLSSIEAALDMASDLDADEVFIIGGAAIYKQLLPRMSRLYLTIVHADVEGDANFPDIDESKWKETSREDHQADEKNEFDYSFVVLERI